jgi:hypothetical protein
MVMKYREFLDLTDEEIKFILTDIFHPTKIENIYRDAECNEIYADITTDGWDDGEEVFDVTDEVELSLNGISVPFSQTPEDDFKWNQFLFAKGCHKLLKNNPYLTD